jgi:hypothetical protein
LFLKVNAYSYLLDLQFVINKCTYSSDYGLFNVDKIIKAGTKKSKMTEM